MYESVNSIWWIEKGILFAVSKGNNEPSSPEEIKRNAEKIFEVTGGNKIPMLVEMAPNAKGPTRESREATAEAFNKICSALAVIARTPLSKMLLQLFFNFKPPAYPVKVFLLEEDARKWLQTFINED